MLVGTSVDIVCLPKKDAPVESSASQGDGSGSLPPSDVEESRRPSEVSVLEWGWAWNISRTVDLPGTQIARATLDESCPSITPLTRLWHAACAEGGVRGQVPASNPSSAARIATIAARGSASTIDPPDGAGMWAAWAIGITPWKPSFWAAEAPVALCQGVGTGVARRGSREILTTSSLCQEVGGGRKKGGGPDNQ